MNDISKDKAKGTRLKPVYFAPGQEKNAAIEKADAWVNGMKGILKSDIIFKSPLAVTQEEELNRLDELIEQDVDALMWSGGGSIYSCRKLAKLGIPIIIWGAGGYAHAGEWDRRGFLESEGAEAYAPLGPSEYDKVIRVIGTPAKLKRSKAIVFGALPNQSPMSSCWDLGMIEREIGVEIKQIDTELLLEEFNKVEVEEGRKVFESWKKDIERINGPGEDEVMRVARLYVVLKKFIERENANAITMNWFHILEWKSGIKGIIPPCFAMAHLTDEGIIAGCEGDLNVLLSMQILNYVSGNTPIMGNIYLHPPLPTTDEPKVPRPPTELKDIKKNIEENLITLSHGVIPLSMCDTKFVVEDYHGQGRGVTGYCHLVEDKPVTLARLSSDLKKLLVIKGHLQKCVNSVVCRFTAWIKVQDVTAVAHNAFSFHHAMVYGDQTKVLKALGEKLGIEVIVV